MSICGARIRRVSGWPEIASTSCLLDGLKFPTFLQICWICWLGDTTNTLTLHFLYKNNDVCVGVFGGSGITKRGPHPIHLHYHYKTRNVNAVSTTSECKMRRNLGTNVTHLQCTRNFRSPLAETFFLLSIELFSFFVEFTWSSAWVGASTSCPITLARSPADQDFTMLNVESRWRVDKKNGQRNSQTKALAIPRIVCAVWPEAPMEFGFMPKEHRPESRT